MRETIQNTNGKQFHAVSLSGGKDSSAMLLLMIERDMPINMVLSADTGMEFPEMYEHLAKLDEHLFRERGIHITTLRHPKGFEYLMFDEPKQKPRSLENRAKLGIPPYGNGWPGIRVRWCTGQLKTHLITKEVNRLKGELGAIHYVGIAADEAWRCKDERYPLVEWGITEAQALQACYDRGFDFGGLYEIYHRASCWCCPFQRIDELRKLRKHHPELWEKLEQEVTRPQIEDGEHLSFAPVDTMIRDDLWICPIRPKHQDQAYYSITKNEIVVPEKEQFKSGEAFYGTLFHEMTHSTGAKDVLDRFKPAAFGVPEYAREELVAELGSALVAQRYGMAKHIKEDSCAYLKGWLDELKESPQFIKTTLLDVKRAASLITQKVDKIARELEQDLGKQERQDNGVAAPERTFYASAAYLQFDDDTRQFDELRDKGDYEGILTLAKEYCDGSGMDEEHTYATLLRNGGDELVAEDKDFAVVYNGSVGGTYDVMQKHTEQEVRDHIRRYGIGRASEDVKEVAKDMAAEEFDALSRQKAPAFEMPGGEVLRVRYNRETDSLDTGPAADSEWTVRHRFPYDHNATPEANLQKAVERLNGMEEYRTETAERSAIHR